jgi:hypothetical protein
VGTIFRRDSIPLKFFFCTHMHFSTGVPCFAPKSKGESAPLYASLLSSDSNIISSCTCLCWLFVLRDELLVPLLLLQLLLKSFASSERSARFLFNGLCCFLSSCNYIIAQDSCFWILSSLIFVLCSVCGCRGLDVRERRCIGAFSPCVGL